MPMPGCAVASVRGSTTRAEVDHASAATRRVIERFVDLMYRRRQVRAAFESCVVATGFLDHGPAGFGSRATAMKLLAPKLGDPQAQVEVLHLVVDGDIGMVHLRVRLPGSAAPTPRVAIFRVAEGRIVEHWGVVGTAEPGPGA